jgi:hypothetical protein
MVCRHWGSRNSIFEEVLKKVLKMKKRTTPLVVVSLLLLSSLAASVMAQSVHLHDGDARSFGDPPDVVAYANVEYCSPPNGVTITDSGSPTIWRYYEWIALRTNDWIEATCTIAGTAAVGVQFYGDSNDGWARVLVDSTEYFFGFRQLKQVFLPIAFRNHGGPVEKDIGPEERRGQGGEIRAVGHLLWRPGSDPTACALGGG